MTDWLIAFALTQLIEIPVYALGPLRRRPLAAFGASAITHPVVWFVLPALWRLVMPEVIYYSGETRLDASFLTLAALYFVFREAFAVIVEALYLRRLGARRPLTWSLLANGASAGFGVVLTYLIGWP